MDLKQAAVSRDLAVGHAQHIAAQTIALGGEVVHGGSADGGEVLRRRWRASCLFGHPGTTFFSLRDSAGSYILGVSTIDIVLRLTSLILRYE